MGDYLFDQLWAQEKRRLDALGAMYDEGTYKYLDQLGIRAGWRCLEVGAGSGTVARWMQTRVGGSGSVVATDTDPRYLENLAEAGIEVRTHDIASDHLEAGSFDLIHTRAVLQHVPKRHEALLNMVQALKPGGRLLIEDILPPSEICYPELPVWTKVMQCMNMGLRSRGADPYYGIKLRSVMTVAGLADVSCEARVPLMFTGEPSMEFVTLSIEQVGGKLVAAGMLTPAELDEALTAFRAPGYTMTAATMFASWGTSPPHAAT